MLIAAANINLYEPILRKATDKTKTVTCYLHRKEVLEHFFHTNLKLNSDYFLSKK